MSLEEISARAPRDAVHQGALLEARRLRRSTLRNCRRTALCSFSTKSRILITSAQFCAPSRLARTPVMTERRRPNSQARWRNPRRAGSSTCRFAAWPIWRGRSPTWATWAFSGSGSIGGVRSPLRRCALAPARFGPGRRRQGPSGSRASAAIARPPRPARPDQSLNVSSLSRCARARKRAIARPG